MTILLGDLKTIFNLQYGHVFSIEFSRCSLICNDFLSGNQKTQTNAFLNKVQINRHLVKLVFIHRSTKFVIFIMQSSVRRTNQNVAMQESGNKIIANSY